MQFITYCLVVQNSPKSLVERARLLFHGTGADRWVDKSMTYVIFANGMAGLHAEHTWGDAPCAAHSMEYFMLNGTGLGNTMCTP